MTLHVPGEPSGPRPRTGDTFRERMARHAARWADTTPIDALELTFVLRPGHWVDLDTLTETALAGLRDAGVLRRGLRGLEAVIAEKRFGPDSGCQVRRSPAAALRDVGLPGPAALDVGGPALGSSPDRGAKRAWRELVAAAWDGRPTPAGDVWVEVVRADARSVTGGLEALLDVLEPVLGRDPRGRPWQEFFPNDDRITWLRVLRAGGGRAVPAAARHPGGGPAGALNEGTSFPEPCHLLRGRPASGRPVHCGLAVPVHF